jgi:glutamate synthase (NADPH/NADH) small chain
MKDGPSLKPKERLQIPRQPMPERDPHQRSTDFEEVNRGFDETLAMLEAERCLRCKKAKCIDGCPVAIDIPSFVIAVAKGDFRTAAEILRRDNALPAVTGRVCPQETQCEALCVRGAQHGAPVAIGHLERFVADWARRHLDTQFAEAPKPPSPDAQKVAIVGSGPAGLTAAGELVTLGYRVTVLEALHAPGGVLMYGIPEFRMPNDIVEEEIDRLRQRGVKIDTNVVVGQTVTIDELMNEEGFESVFIANGAGLPIFLGIPGENLKGVYSANEFLTRVNLMRAYRFPAYDTPVIAGRRAVVVGGGNTAMDAVRTAKRLGAGTATLLYRRSREEMPARAEEIEHAEQEGIHFELLCSPAEILGDEDGWVRAVRVQRMKLAEPDESGRRRPIPISGDVFDLECDLVIEAIGTRANPLLTQTTPDLQVNKWGYIIVDDNGMTSKRGVFAGGDIIRGSATVILAMGDGKKTAAAIDRYLRRKRGDPERPVQAAETAKPAT